MFLLPLLVLALAGFGVYAAVHHRTQPVAEVAGAPAVAAAQRAPFWPTTLQGKVAVGAFAASLLPIAFVNVIQVPYLAAFTLLAALVLSGVARFAEHDHSTSVLITLAISAVAVLAGALFLAGELFIGHE